MTSRTAAERNRCGLCGKTKEQARKLIVGLRSAVCADCVDLCNDILRNTGPESMPKSPAWSLLGETAMWRRGAVARCNSLADVLFAVDLQSPFLDHIYENDRVIRRACFLIEVAHKLDIPIIATEQAPERLGSTAVAVREALGHAEIIPKTEFSAGASPRAMKRFRELARPSAIVVGVETHICVCGTALDLLAAGYRVTVCPDAASSRSLEAHKLGMERIRDAGAMPAHTESVAYEWLGTSSHPKFRDVLEIVKRYAL